MASMLDKAKEFVADKIAHIPKPEATLADVSVKSFSRKAVTLRSDVAVTNPYNHRLPICDVSLGICTRGSNVIWITNPVQGGSVGYVAGPGMDSSSRRGDEAGVAGECAVRLLDIVDAGCWERLGYRLRARGGAHRRPPRRRQLHDSAVDRGGAEATYNISFSHKAFYSGVLKTSN